MSAPMLNGPTTIATCLSAMPQSRTPRRLPALRTATGRKGTRPMARRVTNERPTAITTTTAGSTITMRSSRAIMTTICSEAGAEGEVG